MTTDKSDAVPVTPEPPQWALDAADELDAATITTCGDEKQSARQRRVYVARIIAAAQAESQRLDTEVR